MTQSFETLARLQDLGDGLIMRRSTPADAMRLGAFNAQIHGENPRDAEGVAFWTHDLLLKPHPTFRSDDFVLVEDTQTGQIVSSLNLINQTWAYEGIPFGVGRPELVGTDPAYRSRGLVRKQFDVIHQWSRERGQLVQAITGIPFFYRQFGYEMALNLGGGRWGYEPQVPQLKEGEEDPYQVRKAEEKDIPWLMRMYARECDLNMINAVMDKSIWRYEINGKSGQNVTLAIPCVIETRQGEPVGYLARAGGLWGKAIGLTRYMLAEGVSYRTVTPSVIRYLWALGQVFAQESDVKLETFNFSLGAEHPVYQTNSWSMTGNNLTYAFYMRVADLGAFLGLIAPVLEQRLASSPVAGYSGELKLSFYRTGIKMVFEQGCLAALEDWKPKVHDDEGLAAFPNLTFLQLVFGYRTLEEVRYAYADCWAKPDATVLLNALFPKKVSHVWAIS